MNKYPTNSIKFAARARELFESDSRANHLYAALELRLGIEARTQTYIQTNDQISKEIKNGYHAGKLTKALKATHSDGKFVAKISFQIDSDKQIVRSSYHFIPLSENLLGIYNKLGDFLHYKENGHSFEDAWWDKLKLLLNSGIRDLEVCSNGGLLGVPIWQKSTGQINVKLELASEDPRYEIIKNLAISKESHIVNVEYSDTEKYYESARQD
ncbi:MAG: hypothetical protein Q8R74_14060 [Methylophilus sp.]|nr:hypothetical protein [Methylophilus sp.]